MKKLLIVLVLLASMVGAAWAGSPYDPRSGNHYNTYGNQMNGYNGHTGSQWQNNYGQGGNQYGTDSHGNSWSYDKGSGTYHNYGTGETRQHGKKW